MRLRLLACLPVAGLITFLLFLSAASLVSALERSVTGEEALLEPMRLTKLETVCDGLFRELHALSHEASICGERARCAERSPLLCPAALDEDVDDAYRRLRTALHAQCDFPLRLLDFAWQGPGGGGDHGGARSEASGRPVSQLHGRSPFADDACGERHDWLEAAASGEGEPANYSF